VNVVVDSPAPAAPPSRGPRWLVAGSATLIALIAVVVGYAIASGRDIHLQRATDATSNVVGTLAQNLEADIARVDLALQTAALAHEHARTNEAAAVALAGTVSDLRNLLPEADALRATDAAGRIVVGTDIEPNSPRVNVAERDYFIRARDQPAALAVSEPLRAQISGKWVVVLARPLRTREGQFAGIVSADISAERFQRRFATVDLGRSGAITLRTASMRLVARRTTQGPDESALGTASVSDQLRQALQRQPEGGIYVAPTRIDNIERANAYRRVGTLPLYVLVGLGVDEYLQPWRQQALQLAALALIAGLGTIVASWFIFDTWRRDAEAARAVLRESQRRRALMTTASDGLHVLDRSGRLVEFSDAFAEMLGYKRSQLEGRHVSAWDAANEPTQIERWLKSEKVREPRRFTSRHRRANGEVIHVEILSAALDFEGETLIYCSARDITDSLHIRAREAQARDRAERSERLLQAVADNAPLRIAYIDRELRYRFVNQAHVERFGRAREAILGYTLEELTGEPLSPLLRHELQAALDGQTRRFESEEIVHGQPAIIEKHFVPDRAPDGSVRGLYTVGADVTQRVRQQQRLEAALAERETLLREVYHRVKNNLQVVQSLLNLQLRNVPDGPARAALADSIQRVRAMALVHEKLYSAGNLSAVPAAEYTADLLRQIGDAAGARQRGIELSGDVEAVDITLDLAIPYGLLVTELVTNGLKHGFAGREQGSIQVSLRTQPVGMLLRIADSGNGLPADFSVEAAGSMGLQLAENLASQLGGRLEARNEGGAVFEAFLKRLRPAAEPA
jgi:PAS domain S-box-containing protein